jgi:HAD superfamily hydrolase (TIGR01509 family)
MRTGAPRHEALDLVIFDCDGVLVDSESISNRVLAAALTREGLPTTVEVARRDYQGLLLRDIVASAQRKLGRELPQGWLEQFERARAGAFRRSLAPVHGAAYAVRRIASAGIAVCVASQGKLEKTDLTLDIAGLDDLFPAETRFSAYDVGRGKPYPDLFLQAAATMKASAPRCAVVEDSRSGIAAAVAAGMRAIGYAADGEEVALRNAGGEILHSLDELPGRLGLR